MNRGLVIALLVCACIDYFAAPRWSPAQHGITFLRHCYSSPSSVNSSTPVCMRTGLPSGANFYQRIAQNLQTLEVVEDHPLLGVGFTLYHDTV